MGDLIGAYYSCGCYNRELFAPYMIAKDASFEKYLNKYNVISLDMNELYCNNGADVFKAIKKKINKELKALCPEADIDSEDSIADNMLEVYACTKRQFVFVIDEYDVFFRDEVPTEILDEYLKFLNGLFKGRTMIDVIAFAYLTGILPIAKEKAQSKLNNFREFTILDPGPFAEYIGFTEAETKQLCEQYGMSFEDCKLWYDGYKVGESVSVLTSWSVVLAMEYKKYGNYWSRTSRYDAVSDIFRFNPNIDVREKVAALLRGEEVRLNVNSFTNTITDFKSVDDILTYCIHLGYLGYNSNSKTCYIPNSEVRMEWEQITNDTPVLSDVAKALKTSEELLEATIRKKPADVARLLGLAHNAVMTSKGYNDENGFQSVLSYAYYYAQGPYVIVKELPTGKGFADTLFIPKYPTLGYPAMVVELKVDQTTDTALEQIRSKQYGLDLQNYHGPLLYVAVNYNKDSKEHTCEIDVVAV